MEAQLSIVRMKNGDEGEEIRLILRLAMGKTITTTLTPEDFALALTGKSEMSATVRTRNVTLELVR